MKRILIAAAAAALLIAGCGESQQFTEDFNEAQKPLERLLADGLDDTAAKIGALDAPDDAKDELDTFVKEVNASADSMREVGKAVDGGKPEAMTAALGELQDHMTKVSSAQTALQNAIN